MNAFKGILWGLAISAMLWAAILVTANSITKEMDWRKERVEKRGKVNAWLCERAVNEYKTSIEWTR